MLSLCRVPLSSTSNSCSRRCPAGDAFFLIVSAFRCIPRSVRADRNNAPTWKCRTAGARRPAGRGRNRRLAGGGGVMTAMTVPPMTQLQDDAPGRGGHRDRPEQRNSACRHRPPAVSVSEHASVDVSERRVQTRLRRCVRTPFPRPCPQMCPKHVRRCLQQCPTPCP